MSEIFSIVENNYNITYIDSLLMALFYNQINFTNNKLINTEYLYIQGLIQYNFIDVIKKNHSLDMSILNEIRNYSIICGWKPNENILDLYDVIDYYKFLLDGFNNNFLLFKLTNINNNKEEIKKLYYIDITLEQNNVETTIYLLLNTWIDNNLICTYNKYNFIDIPNYIPIYIERKYNNKLNVKKIDIMKKIRFQQIENITYTIHSIICYSTINNHYYTLLCMTQDKWLLYNSTLKPSLFVISDFKYCDFVNKIKQECVFIFYKLDK
jgi:hypothetical protein